MDWRPMCFLLCDFAGVSGRLLFLEDDIECNPDLEAGVLNGLIYTYVCTYLRFVHTLVVCIWAVVRRMNSTELSLYYLLPYLIDIVGTT